MSLEQWRTDLWQKALPETHRHLTYDIYEQWLKLRYHYLELPSELVQMLKQLRKNYLLAIITNGPSNAQWEKVHKLGLNMGKSSLFDCILVSADLAWEKPDPRIFLAACNYLGVAPNNCIMVGDKIETDIQVKPLNHFLSLPSFSFESPSNSNGKSFSILKIKKLFFMRWLRRSHFSPCYFNHNLPPIKTFPFRNNLFSRLSLCHSQSVANCFCIVISTALHVFDGKRKFLKTLELESIRTCASITRAFREPSKRCSKKLSAAENVFLNFHLNCIDEYSLKALLARLMTTCRMVTLMLFTHLLSHSSTREAFDVRKFN